MHTLSVNSLNIKEERSKFCKEPEKKCTKFLMLVFHEGLVRIKHNQHPGKNLPKEMQ